MTTAPNATFDVSMTTSTSMSVGDPAVIHLRIEDRLSGLPIFDAELSAEQMLAFLRGTSTQIDAFSVLVVPELRERVGRRMTTTSVPIGKLYPFDQAERDAAAEKQADHIRETHPGGPWEESVIRYGRDGYSVRLRRWDEPTSPWKPFDVLDSPDR